MTRYIHFHDPVEMYLYYMSFIEPKQFRSMKDMIKKRYEINIKNKTLSKEVGTGSAEGGKDPQKTGEKVWYTPRKHNLTSLWGQESCADLVLEVMKKVDVDFVSGVVGRVSQSTRNGMR